MDKLSFTAAKWQTDSAGEWLMVNVKDGQAKELCEKLLKDKKYDLTVKQHREHRSLDANAYAWVLIDKLSEVLQKPKSEIYRQAIREIGGVSEKICLPSPAAKRLARSWDDGKHLGRQAVIEESVFEGCSTLTLFFGSSEYDTAQMSALIENIIQDCKAVGIETLPSEKLAILTEEWGK